MNGKVLDGSREGPLESPAIGRRDWRFRSLLIVLGIALLGLDIANAQRSQQTTKRLEERLLEMDTNGDGSLDSKEVDSKKKFKTMDTNSDGFVTFDEARAYYVKQRSSRTSEEADESTDILRIVPNENSMAAKRLLISKIIEPQRESKHPTNVVLILADDLGYADTSVYGSNTIPTPHIDALASAGVRLTDAYVTAASCSPSRAGLMSGRYQQRFGFEFNTSLGKITHQESRGLDPAAVILADVFKQTGYATGMFGKWHLGTQPYFHPQKRGFDEFYGFLAGAHSFFPVKKDEKIYATIMRGQTPIKEQEYLTDAIAREAVNFIREHKDEPFFVYVPFNAVHTPIEATEKYQKRFPNETNPTQRDYNAMTSALDDAVGEIVGVLKETGIDGETLVIFLNDNGGPIYTNVQNNAPLRLGKLFLFEGGIRVPMIIHWPGVLESGSVYRKMVSSLDVFPTACAAAGIRLPAELQLDGVNLLPYLKGENTASPHEALFWSNGPNKAVRLGRWKLVMSGEHIWLFDLDNEIGETTNLAQQHPDIVKKLVQALEEWLSEMPPPAWPSKPQRQIIDVDGVPYELNI